MANICLDTVIFYSDDTNNELVVALGNVVEKAYPQNTSVYKQQISVLLEQLDIDKTGLPLRGDVTYYEVNSEYVKLYVDAAWTPLYGCYQAIAKHFGLQFVLRAEEPGCGVFINTDIDCHYFSEKYRLYLCSEDADGTEYEYLYSKQEDKEAYFETEQELLAYLSQYGFVLETFADAVELLDNNYICINEFRENYE